MPTAVRTIVIVGGGFCGTLLSASLLRRPPAQSTHIVLVERSAVVGRGVAYASRRFPYLLNVPASRMSANSVAPDEFLEFARRRIPTAHGDDFLPRSLYGEYLEELLRAARADAPRNVRFDVLHAEAINVRRVGPHLPLQVELHDGRVLKADEVVLALGNPRPAPLPVAASIAGHPAYVADPWAADLQFSRNQRVLLIGTGLTAADIINLASCDPHRTPTMLALSRHGRVPPCQTPARPDAFRGDGNALLLAASTSLRRLTRAVRLLASEAERCGGDWREAITFVRHMAPAIWQRLSERDRVRFLNHLRTYWDIHRHRLPPRMVHTVETLQSARRLQILAGRIQQLSARGERIEVVFRLRGSQTSRSQMFDRVVNCTGPDYAIARSAEPLWRNLLQCGLCVADPLGLGLRASPTGAVIDADGKPGSQLYYVGPMLRADVWEASAAHELRSHVQRLAAVLASQRR